MSTSPSPTAPSLRRASHAPQPARYRRARAPRWRRPRSSSRPGAVRDSSSPSDQPPPDERAGLCRGSLVRGALQPTVGGVEPADDGVEPEELSVDDEGEGEVEVRFVLFEARPLLHQLDQIPAMDLDH